MIIKYKNGIIKIFAGLNILLFILIIIIMYSTDKNNLVPESYEYEGSSISDINKFYLDHYPSAIEYLNDKCLFYRGEWHNNSDDIGCYNFIFGKYIQNDSLINSTRTICETVGYNFILNDTAISCKLDQ